MRFAPLLRYLIASASTQFPMAKKYQVFIIPTFDGLKEHRNTVVKAVLQLGHLPVGMEMFNAGDQAQ